MNNEQNNERRFDKFEKLDRKVEQTIQEVETMTWRQRLRKMTHNSFAVAAIWAIILNLLIETLGRFPTTTIWGGLQFMVQEPLIFLYNTMIIFATLVIASIFKRRLFVFTVITIFWLIIGIVNGVILTQRMTPFTVKDLSILDDGITIVTNYLSTAQIVMAAAGVVFAIGLLVLLYIKGPKKALPVKWKRNLIGHCHCYWCDFWHDIIYDRFGKSRNILWKSGLRLQRLRSSLLLYQYMA